MSRYIDAEKLKCSIDSETDSIFDRNMTIEELYYNLCKLIDDEPTADVQEVVRCKDCKYRKSSEFCECREPDFYCADGARMDGKDGEE